MKHHLLILTDTITAIFLLMVGCGHNVGASSSPSPDAFADSGADVPCPPTTTPRLVLFLGNSLTRGSGASSPSAAYPTVTMRELGIGDAWENLGHDSETTQQMAQEAPLLVDVQADGTRPTIAIVWEIGNDLWYGANQTDAFQHFVDYCRTRRKNGFRVVALTITPRLNPTAPATWETDRLAINGRLRAEWTGFADGLADVAAAPELGNAGDRAIYGPDGIHLIDAGYAAVARIVADVLRQVR
jgi:lysophospholipase L1-like esterase